MAFRFRRAGGTGRNPSTAPGERVYAIGDVHGRHDLLARLLDRISAHAAARRTAETTYVVQVGDLIDRGPASAQVVQLMMEAQRENDWLIALRGNHEETMTQALRGNAEAYRIWRRIGGSATMRSFGVEPRPRDVDNGEALPDLRAAVPAAAVDWLANLPLSARSGDYFFCHAGVRPGVPLRRQSHDDLLWIRESFLDDPSDHGAMIVHGHTISREVEMRPNRIGIDTGAYRTGVLSAVCLEGEDREIISTPPD